MSFADRTALAGQSKDPSRMREVCAPAGAGLAESGACQVPARLPIMILPRTWPVYPGRGQPGSVALTPCPDPGSGIRVALRAATPTDATGGKRIYVPSLETRGGYYHLGFSEPSSVACGAD